LQCQQLQEAFEAAERAAEVERREFQQQEKALRTKLDAALAQNSRITEQAQASNEQSRKELEDRLVNVEGNVELLRSELKKSRDAEQALRTEGQNLQEKLRLALEANRKLQEVERVASEESSSTIQLQNQEVEHLREENNRLEDELTSAARDATKAREELAREKTALQIAREDLDKAAEALREVSAAKELLRSEVSENASRVQQMENRILELTSLLSKAQQSNQDAFSKEMVALQTATMELRSKLKAVADKLDKKQRQLEEEQKARQEVEEEFERAQEQHSQELRQQREHFEETLREQRAIEDRLRAIATQDDDADRQALQEMSREIMDLRRRLATRPPPVQAQIAAEPSSLVSPHHVGAMMNVHNEGFSGEESASPVVIALQDRVEALEESNKLLSRAFRESTLQSNNSDQARTIHQLTMEIEASKRAFHQMRQRLLHAGLLHGRSSNGPIDSRNHHHSSNTIYTGPTHEQSMLTDHEWSASGTREEDDDLSGMHQHQQQQQQQQHQSAGSFSVLQTSAISPASSSVVPKRSGPRAPKTANRALRHEVDMLQDALDKEREARRAAETKAGFLQSEFTDLFVQYFQAEKDATKVSRKAARAAGASKSRVSKETSRQSRTHVSRSRSRTTRAGNSASLQR